MVDTNDLIEFFSDLRVLTVICIIFFMALMGLIGFIWYLLHGQLIQAVQTKDREPIPPKKSKQQPQP